MGPILMVMIVSGLMAGVIGRRKGSSFFIWLLVGFFVPVLGVAAALLYRREQAEPERRCPRCNATHKLYVQVCNRCGEDLYLPPVGEVRQGSDFR